MTSSGRSFLISDSSGGVTTAGLVMPVVFRPLSVPTMAGCCRCPAGVISVDQSIWDAGRPLMVWADAAGV